MRITHFTTYPNQGGAGIAAWRLVDGLRSCGVEAELVGIWKKGAAMLPGQKKFGYDRKLSNRLWRLVRKFQVERFNKRFHTTHACGGMPFFTDLSPLGQPMLDSAMGADIVHLHWVCDFIDYEYFFSKLPVGVPIFWTLHDMSPFTGGCSYSRGCQRFLETCGKCPLLDSKSSDDESARVLQRKIQALSPHFRNLWIITPSQWLGDIAQKSRIFSGANFHVIPNGLEIKTYNPILRERGRAMISATDHEKVVLFVAAILGQEHKGSPILIEAWRKLEMRGVKIKVVCIGDSTGFEAPDAWQVWSSIDNENDKAALYAAADALVVPSEEDNYPNVICEALSSGVPIIGSHVGGIPELVLEGVTGYTMKHRNADCLADTLQTLFESIIEKRATWSERCREFAQRTFNLLNIANEHINLYNRAIEKS